MPLIARPPRAGEAAERVAIPREVQELSGLDVETAEGALMDNQSSVARNDEVLSFVGGAPEGVPGWLGSGCVEERLDAVGWQVQESEAHERSHTVIPVAVGRAIEDQESVIARLCRHDADALAAADPEDRGEVALPAVRSVEHKERSGRRLVLEITTNTILF